MADELNQAKATILRLEPGDVLFIKFPEETMTQPHIVEQAVDAIQRAVEAAGRAEDVGVVLTADAIELTVVRA